MHGWLAMQIVCLLAELAAAPILQHFLKIKMAVYQLDVDVLVGRLRSFGKGSKKTHGADTKHAKVYQAAADLAEMQILDQEAE